MVFGEDTIAAIATAIGESSIGIIRISGPDAIKIAEDIFKFAGKRKKWTSFHFHYGYIVHPEDQSVMDEVLLGVMKAPKSYTREDVVEIHSHGGYVSMQRIFRLVLECGARVAEPGEFTKRAFLNGRIDLSQAEAVADIIKAKTDFSLDLALRQLEGELSQKLNEIMQQLGELAAFLEASIDFPEDGVEELEAAEVAERIKGIRKMIYVLLSSSNSGKVLRDGLKTVILGKPNVGKSSLLNAMLKENRAIVTAIPGTTRDIIEETISVNGIPLQIVDTAGIRDTDDLVERLGVEKAVEYAKKADLVLFLLDDTEGISESDRRIMEILSGRKTIVLINKTDVSINRITNEDLSNLIGNSTVIRISVLLGTGMKELEDEISNMVYSGSLRSQESVIVTNNRHIQLLKMADNNLVEAENSLECRIPLDLVSIDIRNSIQYLGEIIGSQVSEDLLDTIFSQFCLGK